MLSFYSLFRLFANSLAIDMSTVVIVIRCRVSIAVYLQYGKWLDVGALLHRALHPVDTGT